MVTCVHKAEALELWKTEGGLRMREREGAERRSTDAKRQLNNIHISGFAQTSTSLMNYPSARIKLATTAVETTTPTYTHTHTRTHAYEAIRGKKQRLHALRG